MGVNLWGASPLYVNPSTFVRQSNQVLAEGKGESMGSGQTFGHFFNSPRIASMVSVSRHRPETGIAFFAQLYPERTQFLLLDHLLEIYSTIINELEC